MIFTPVIIKFVFQRLTAENPQACYCCVNKGQATMPEQIKKQAIRINSDIACVIDDLSRKNIS